MKSLLRLFINEERQKKLGLTEQEYALLLLTDQFTKSEYAITLTWFEISENWCHRPVKIFAEDIGLTIEELNQMYDSLIDRGFIETNGFAKDLIRVAPKWKDGLNEDALKMEFATTLISNLNSVFSKN